MAFQDLQTVTRLCLPHPRCFVRRSREDSAALRIECHFGDLTLVARQDRMAGPCHCVVYAGVTVRWGRHKLWTRSIEGNIQDLIVMSPESMHTSATCYVPNLARPVDRPWNAEVGGKVELTARYLTLMSRQGMNTATCADIPHLDRVIETASDYALPLSIEIKGHNLSSVTKKCVEAVTGLYVPQTGSVVHGTSGYHRSVRVERQAYDLRGMPFVGVIQLTSLRTPQLASFIYFQ